jgi:hypothetical protein
MNTLDDFLKRTIDRFHYLDYTDRDFSDVYEMIISIKATSDGYAISEARGKELAKVELREAHIFYIEDLCEELSKLLRTPFFYSWLNKKDEEYDSLKIILYNGLPFEMLVHVSDGVFRFDCWHTLDEMRRNGDL